MSDRPRWAKPTRVTLAIVAAALIPWQAWRHLHDFVLPEKFRVVEPGAIYRGAWQKPWPMRGILRGYQIKTVVALAHTADEPLVVEEKALVEGLGVRWIHVPIYYDSRDPGSSGAVADRLERAAALVADPANQPVFFHCHHGVNRASMVQIAYRTAHCGWDLERAQAEVSRMTGWKRSRAGTGRDYMDTFYRERVLPRRGATAPAVALDSSASPR